MAIIFLTILFWSTIGAGFLVGGISGHPSNAHAFHIWFTFFSGWHGFLLMRFCWGILSDTIVNLVVVSPIIPITASTIDHDFCDFCHRSRNDSLN
jgi:hypothetical protein